MVEQKNNLLLSTYSTYLEIVVTMSIFIYEPLPTTGNEEIYLQDSESYASEFLENLEEMFFIISLIIKI